MKALFEPIRVGDVEIKNRFALLPMGMGYCEEGFVTDRLIDFYVEMAKGDVGLIYVVGTYNDFGFSNPHFIALEDDKFLPGLRRLADALHAYGARVFMQLMHMGASAPSLIIGGGATGAETALFLARKGTLSPETAVFLASRGGLSAEEAIEATHRGIKTVTILEMMGRIGEDIGRSTRWTVLQSLRLYNVETITRAKVVRVTDKGVFYDREGQEQFIEADTVVIAMGSVPVAELKEKIEGLVPQLYAIGDCVKPRKALDAIHEAYAVAREI